MKKGNTWKLLLTTLLVLSCLNIGLAASKTTVLKLAHVNNMNQPIHLTCEKLAELVAERTNNRIQIKVFPAGQLGTNTEIFQGVKFGTIEMGVFPPSALADVVPGYEIYDAGYVFRDLDHFKKVVDGPIGAELSAELIKKGGMRVLGVELLGIRHLTTKNKPVKRPEDLVGMKIRAVEFPIYLEVVNGMGATATPVAFQEVFGALQSGIVDGQENPIPSIWSMKLQEVQRYIMLTGHIMAGLTISINERTYQKLSSADQAILAQAMKDAIAYGEEILLAQEEENLKELVAAGMIVIGPEEGLQLEAFKKRVVDHVLPKFEQSWGKGLYERIQQVK